MDTDERFDEIETRVNELSRDVESLRSAQSIRKELEFPPTINDKKVINSVIYYPIVRVIDDPITSHNYEAIFCVGTEGWEVYSMCLCYKTASSSGSVQLQRLAPGVASGSGQDLLTAGISTSGTANTVYNGTLAGSQYRQLYPGDRLSLTPSGTLAGLDHLVVTVILKLTV